MKPVERNAKLLKAILLLAFSMLMNLMGYMVSNGKATPLASTFVCLGIIALFVGEFIGIETFLHKKMERE